MPLAFPVFLYLADPLATLGLIGASLLLSKMTRWNLSFLKHNVLFIKTLWLLKQHQRGTKSPTHQPCHCPLLPHPVSGVLTRLISQHLCLDLATQGRKRVNHGGSSVFHQPRYVCGSQSRRTHRRQHLHHYLPCRQTSARS